MSQGRYNGISQNTYKQLSCSMLFPFFPVFPFPPFLSLFVPFLLLFCSFLFLFDPSCSCLFLFLFLFFPLLYSLFVPFSPFSAFSLFFPFIPSFVPFVTFFHLFFLLFISCLPFFLFASKISRGCFSILRRHGDRVFPGDPGRSLGPHAAPRGRAGDRHQVGLPDLDPAGRLSRNAHREDPTHLAFRSYHI